MCKNYDEVIGENMTKLSIRTPLGRARGLGSAKDGTAHWWAQRVTSVMLLPVTLYILFHLGRLLPEPYDTGALGRGIARPGMALALIVGVMCGFYHAWLGVRVIIEDYVHREGAKFAALLASTLLFFFCGCACVFSVMYIVMTINGGRY
jgi:succinate dehydrogenase / fumarate reductase membrane anchor subunit